MTRTRRWLLGLGIVLGLSALLWVAMVRLVPSDDELARRAAVELETWLGVKVSVGALRWRLLRVVVPDIAAYDRVYKRLINGADLGDVSSSFAMEQIKYTTKLPLDYLATSA